MRWIGLIGALVGILGCGWMAGLQMPTSLVWAMVLSAGFAAAAWFAFSRHRAGLAAVGILMTILAYLGMWSIGTFLLPGATLVTTAAVLPGVKTADEEPGPTPYALIGAAAVAGVATVLAADALSTTAWVLAFPALLVMATALAWALGGKRGPLVAAAAWAGFAWMRGGLSLWYGLS